MKHGVFRFFGLFLAVLLTFPLLAVPAAPAAFAAEKAVYLKKGGAGEKNGSSPDNAFSTLTEAYAALGNAGGRIVICGEFTINGHFTEPVHEGVVTVTQNYNDVDYRNIGSVNNGDVGRRWILNGPTVFTDITFTTGAAENVNSYILFVAQNNPITFAEGVSCEGFQNTIISKSVAVLGGRQSGVTPAADRGNDSHITIKSGTFIVVGLNRQITSTHSGVAHIEIDGGNIARFYGGNVNNGTGGGLELTVNGGRFTGAVDCADKISGAVSVTVNGGDFTQCPSITGNANGVLTVADGVKDAVNAIASGFAEIHTSSGVVHNLVAEEAFGAATFTDSHGNSIPYRYYFPEGYDKNADTLYPVFFYFHGNGSRGSDNKKQLSATTHLIVTKVLNYSEKAIIVAPQCPASPEEWTDHTCYPGHEDYDPESTPLKTYMTAALELYNFFLANEKIDPARIYIAGASNGAGACWNTIVHSPKTVAAAAIFAGTGQVGGAEKIAEYYLNTPIWTFHGDADTTLDVNGTRGIVNAVLALGGTKMTYTEMPGYGHNIWVDAANTAGLLDWMFSQRRTDSVGVFRLGDEFAETQEDLASMRVNPDRPILLSASLSLLDEIGLNYYLYLPETLLADSGAYLLFDGPNGEKQVPLTDGIVKTDGSRRYSYFLYAKQLQEEVTVRLFTGDGEQADLYLNDAAGTKVGSEGYFYSVADYLDSIAVSDESSEMKALAAALEDYGLAVKRLFAAPGETVPSVQTDLSAITAESTSTYRLISSGTPEDGFTLSGATLLLESTTTLRVYYSSAGPVSVTLNGAPAEPQAKGNARYINVAGLKPTDFATAHTIRFGDYEIACSALTYAYSVLSYYPESDTSEQAATLRDVARTLVRYHQTAVAYFQTVGN